MFLLHAFGEQLEIDQQQKSLIISDERYATMAVGLVNGVFYHTIVQANQYVSHAQPPAKNYLKEIILMRGPEVKLRDVCKRFNLKKDDALPMLRELEALGFGAVALSASGRTSTFKKTVVDKENANEKLVAALSQIKLTLESYITSLHGVATRK